MSPLQYTGTHTDARRNRLMRNQKGESPVFGQLLSDKHEATRSQFCSRGLALFPFASLVAAGAALRRPPHRLCWRRSTQAGTVNPSGGLSEGIFFHISS